MSFQSITQLPTDLLLHTVRSFLHAAEIFSLGRCDWTLLKVSQLCDLPNSCIKLDEFVRERWESNEMYDALTESARMKLPIEYRAKVTTLSQAGNRKERIHLAAAKTKRRIIESKYQIGRITAIELLQTQTKAIKILQPHLHLLAPSIRSLTLGADIELYSSDAFRLPPHLTALILRGSFAGELEGVTFPSGLRVLKFAASQFKSSLKRVRFPDTLTVLDMSRYDKSISDVILPPSLTNLFIYGKFSEPPGQLMALPHGLLSLRVYGEFHHPTFDQMKLPSTLTSMQFSHSFDHPSLKDWIPPYSLTLLSIPSRVCLPGQPIEMPGTFLVFELPPRSTVGPINFYDYLKSVRFIGNDVRLCDARFPPSVHTIDLGSFTQSMAKSSPWHPPPSLTELNTGDWNHPLKELPLPASVRVLTLAWSYSSSIANVIWPQQLERLSIQCFPWQVGNIGVPKNLPKTIKQIEVRTTQVPQEWLSEKSIPQKCAIYDNIPLPNSPKSRWESSYTPLHHVVRPQLHAKGGKWFRPASSQV